MPRRVPVSAVLAALSRALDLTEGHPRGHAARSAAIGVRIGRALGLPQPERADLLYALLLKDAGCSSNAARVYELFGGPNEHEVKRAVWERDWRKAHAQVAYALGWTERGGPLAARVRRLTGLALAGRAAARQLFQIRCTRGAEISQGLGLPIGVARAIYNMDEHWDGGGHPSGAKGDEIPIAAQIIGLAQVAEIFASMHGPTAAVQIARERRGRWFNPVLVDMLAAFEHDTAFWSDLSDLDRLPSFHVDVETGDELVADEAQLDRVADAFALIIDGKSRYTFDHSRRVSAFSVALGERLGLAGDHLTRLRRAGLVHDLGKLAVPNAILDKPARLSEPEWIVMRRHPAVTLEILEQVPLLSELALDAASHHERVDGRGYHRGIAGDQLSLAARILAVADVMDALSADRPYRAGLAPGEVLDEIRRSAGTQLCGVCVEACSESVIERATAA